MDLILINGNFVTMDKNNPKAEAVAIRKGRFKKVGRNEDVLQLKHDKTEVIDLNGKTVTPGFNDSHIHLLNYGYSLKKIDCSNAQSIDEVIKQSKKFLESHPLKKDEWIMGRGWNDLFFKDKRELNRHDLDKISTEYPICFTRICEHILVANSKAMELAGITKNTLQPTGGYFDIDEDGEPLGIFRETARYMIYNKIPDANVNEIKEMILYAARIASKYGITSVQTDDFEALPGKNFENIIRAYKELAKTKDLPVRVYAQCLLPDINGLDRFLKLGYKTGLGNEYYKIGPLKLLTDGSLGARTAYLSKPYMDAPSTVGVPVFTQKELDRLVITAHKNHMKIVLHAIGDAAMHMCFESFKKAQLQHFKKDPRFGIIHLQITNQELIEKFKRQNVIAFAEPICLNNDLHMVEDRIGEERAKTSYSYKSLFDKGINVCISSDCPVDSLNPMKNIYVGVTRKDYRGYPRDGWLPEERITVEQALYGFTMGSAYASYEDDIKGSIEENKLADMAVLSDDIYKVAPEEIKDISVEMTFMDGKLVYKKE